MSIDVQELSQNENLRTLTITSEQSLNYAGFFNLTTFAACFLFLYLAYRKSQYLDRHDLRRHPLSVFLKLIGLAGVVLIILPYIGITCFTAGKIFWAFVTWDTDFNKMIYDGFVLLLPMSIIFIMLLRHRELITRDLRWYFASSKEDKMQFHYRYFIPLFIILVIFFAPILTHYKKQKEFEEKYRLPIKLKGLSDYKN